MGLQAIHTERPDERGPEERTPAREERRPRRTPRRLAHPVRIILLVVVSGAVLAGGTAFAVTSAVTSRGKTGTASAANDAEAANHARAGTAIPLRVLSISPGSSADPVTAAAPVRVVFSAPLSPTSRLPAISPAVPGRWRSSGADAIVFTPAAPIAADQEMTLLVPAGPSGVRSASGADLADPAVAVFQAGGWSTLRLEALLAQLGYLPLSFTPRNGSGFPAGAGSGAVTVSTVSQVGTAGTASPALAGSFSWQGSYPAALTSQWQPGKPGVILTGAIMAFQADHQLPLTGTAGPVLWQHLLTAVELGQRNRHGYSYALADKGAPNTLTVWHNGVIVASGLANTGAAVTPTPDGTWPVYLRRRYQVMRGLMPDGTPYADPAQYVSYFYGDYAVHSMDRTSFGTPQSLGCVELPLAEAGQVWPYLTYGTLVTVAGGPGSGRGAADAHDVSVRTRRRAARPVARR